MKTFAEFLQSGAAEIDEEFVRRCERAGVKIQSLHNLLNFARERWPTSYPKHWRSSTVDEPYGREAMGLLWSKYLEWADADELTN